MGLKEKYRKVYWVAISLFAIVNIAALLFIFKKYRKDSSSSLQVSKVKLKFSKVKEKISTLEASTAILDTLNYLELNTIIQDKNYLDSILSSKDIQLSSISTIERKVDELDIKSDEIKKSENVDTISVRSHS